MKGCSRYANLRKFCRLIGPWPGNLADFGAVFCASPPSGGGPLRERAGLRAGAAFHFGGAAARPSAPAYRRTASGSPAARPGLAAPLRFHRRRSARSTRRSGRRRVLRRSHRRRQRDGGGGGRRRAAPFPRRSPRPRPSPCTPGRGPRAPSTSIWTGMSSPEPSGTARRTRFSCAPMTANGDDEQSSLPERVERHRRDLEAHGRGFRPL